MQIEALIERLKKMDGPDREVDAEIFCIDLPEAPRLLPYWTDEQRKDIIPRYTASLDTAIALVEKVTPWMWRSIEWAGTNKPPSEWPLVEFGFGDFKGKVQAKTAPIALCLALLRALQSGGRS